MTLYIQVKYLGPTPCGVGGLKSAKAKRVDSLFLSHPMRGGWIEISHDTPIFVDAVSHPMRGGWIEMFTQVPRTPPACPTPCGVGGLKFKILAHDPFRFSSHPMRGGWIEIRSIAPDLLSPLSHPMRGGWIEIRWMTDQRNSRKVPPHAGWVD